MVNIIFPPSSKLGARPGLPGPPRGSTLPPGVLIHMILTLLSMGSGTIKPKIMPNPCEPRREGQAWGRGHRSRLRADDGRRRPRYHSSLREVSKTHNENVRCDDNGRPVIALVAVLFRQSDRTLVFGLPIKSMISSPVTTGPEGTLHGHTQDCSDVLLEIHNY